MPNGPLVLLEQKRDQYCAAIAIDRLFDRLAASSKRILCRAAVHPGPILLDGLAAVASASSREVQDELSAWRRSALIYPESESADPPWSVYGILRGWLTALPRLAIEDRRAAHRAAADYLIQVPEQQHPKLQLTRLGCLAQARAHYLAGGADAEARTTTDRICECFSRQGEYAEIERLNAELLDYELHPNPATWIGRSYLERSEYDKSRQWYEQALKLAADKHPKEKAEAIQGLATIDLREGHLSAAREQFDDALKIQASIGDRLGQKVSWHQLGSIDFKEKHYAEARAKFDMALSLLEGMSDEDEKQAIWHQVGSIELDAGHLKEARTTLEKALAIARKLDDRKAQAAAIHQLGRVDAAAGAPAQALQQLRDALEIRQSIGDRAGEALSFRRLGDLAGQLGHPDIALRLSSVCYVIHKTVGHGDANRDIAEVQQQANSLNYTPERLKSLLAEVEQDYLRDRAKTLLKQAFAMQ
jgi:tetratricopeptide (TPR) repeat protein